jgi:hypothetical protein
MPPAFAPCHHHHIHKFRHAQCLAHPFNQYLNAFLDFSFTVREGKLTTACIARLRTRFFTASTFISIDGFISRNAHRYRVGHTCCRMSACTIDEDTFFIAPGKVAADIFLLFGTCNVKEEVGTVEESTWTTELFSQLS